MVGLGDLAGGSFSSSASAVSSDGSVIGGRGDDGASGMGTAFIWDSVNGMRNLQNLLANEYGYNLTGWQLHNVTSISPDGNTLVGYGTFGGNFEMWMAVIPEPSTYAMTAAAALLLWAAGVKRRRL